LKKKQVVALEQASSVMASRTAAAALLLLSFHSALVQHFQHTRSLSELTGRADMVASSLPCMILSDMISLFQPRAGMKSALIMLCCVFASRFLCVRA
jgi:streptomycin 6-kinase